MFYNEYTIEKGDVLKMSIKNIIKELSETGRITQEVTVQGVVFTLKGLSTEEQLLSESISSLDSFKDKYKASGDISSYADTISKVRNLSLLTFLIRSIDGIPVVDETLSLPKQFKERLDFRDDLSSLAPAMVDALLIGYDKLVEKNKTLYSDVRDNLGK